MILFYMVPFLVAFTNAIEFESLKVKNVAACCDDDGSVPNPEELFTEYFEWKKSQFPQQTYVFGLDHKGTKSDDNSKIGREKRLEGAEKFNQNARKILKNTNSRIYNIDKKQEFYLNMMLFETDIFIKNYGLNGQLLAPVNFMQGIQTGLPQVFGSKNKFRWDSDEDFRVNLERLKNVPAVIDQTLEDLKEGVRLGITYANESLIRAQAQFQSLQVSDIEESQFLTQFLKNDKVKDEAKQIVQNDILPRFKLLQDYIYGEYQNHLRKGPGVVAMNNLQGSDFYKGCLHSYTSLDNLDPADLYQYGVENVDKSQKRFVELSILLGHGNESMTFDEAAEKVSMDQSYLFENSNQVIEAYNDEVDNVIPRLKSIFHEEVLTEKVLNINVKPVPPGGGGIAYYESGSADGRRNGTFFINVNNPKQVSKAVVATFTLHEGQPGHHLQLAVKEELESIPDFARYTLEGGSPSGFPGYSGFAEGWGLYSETLGYELGVYENEPMKELGKVMGDLLRSARLVVDTGLHQYGWSRQNAIDYLVKNAAFSRGASEAEVDRYISLPGQAVSYKVGERKILELRKKFVEERGENLKDFHAYLLQCEGPLSNVESCLDARFQKVF